MSGLAFRRSLEAGRILGRAVALSALLALAACNSGGSDESPEVTTDALEPERPAGELYNQGLAFMAEGNLRRAIDSFEEVDRQHPYSEEARKAHIMMIFAHFRDEDYDQTIQTARRYLALYPSSEDAAYAQYLIGESYFRQIPDITRDQESSIRAIQAMQEIVNNYPESEYAAEAQNKINAAKDQLAGREMQIGRYYLERREYVAAVNRFRVVVTEYQTTRHVEEALLRLTETYLALGLASEAQTAGAVLGHNYPNSEWYTDALALLQGGGLEPAEDQGSWISRLFRGDRA
jgi:outer membrane protein assembly factor BamD